MEAALQSGRWQRVRFGALVLGVIGLALCVLGALFNRQQFFQSYLFAYVFWLGIAVGCLGFVMLHNLSGGGWGIAIRHLLESGMNTMPLMALLFVPLVFGVHHLYEWARPEAVAEDIFLQHKSGYLNLPFFFVRAAVYFGLWIAAAVLLSRWSIAARTDLRYAGRLRALSGAGLVIYVLTITFASIDWIMSLEAHWYSTIFGVHFLSGHALAALAFAVLFSAIVEPEPALAGSVEPTHRLDLGNLLLGFVMLWAYFTLSQWLIIWSGNLPEEAVWYTHRNEGGWEWLPRLLVLFHFFAPFLLLLSRRSKRTAVFLSTIAGLILVMRLADVFWYIVPSFRPGQFFVHWMDVAAASGLGGIWLAVFLWQLDRLPLINLQAPKFHEDVHRG